MSEPSAFRVDLESLVNRHSMENGSDTPDFVLATFLASCLDAFDGAVKARERWYGRIDVAAAVERVDADGEAERP